MPSKIDVVEVVVVEIFLEEITGFSIVTSGAYSIKSLTSIIFILQYLLRYKRK